MRTTIDVPDALYRQLKSKAAAEGRSVRALVLDAAMVALAPPRARRQRRVQLPLVRSKRPGTIHLDNARIEELLTQGDLT